MMRLSSYRQSLTDCLQNLHLCTHPGLCLRFGTYHGIRVWLWCANRV